MPKSEPMLSVAEVLEMQPGDDQNATWINPGFIAEVAAIKPTTVKSTWNPMNICTLKDTSGSATISMTVFGPVKFGIGATIEVSGKGLRRTEYKGMEQVSVGKETEIHVVSLGKTPAPPTNSEPVAGQRMPDGTEPTQPVYGGTVGMAMKEALALLTRELTRDELIEQLVSQSFWKAVHEVSSDIIQVSLLLEKGRLAPSVKERTAGPAPAAPQPEPQKAAAPSGQPRRGQPQTERQAANQADVVDEDVQDVPF